MRASGCKLTATPTYTRRTLGAQPPPRKAGTGTPARRKAQSTLGRGLAWTGPVAGVARPDVGPIRCRSDGTACNGPPATDTRGEPVHLEHAARDEVEQPHSEDAKERAAHGQHQRWWRGCAGARSQRDARRCGRRTCGCLARDRTCGCPVAGGHEAEERGQLKLEHGMLDEGESRCIGTRIEGRLQAAELSDQIDGRLHLARVASVCVHLARAARRDVQERQAGALAGADEAANK